MFSDNDLGGDPEPNSDAEVAAKSDAEVAGQRKETAIDMGRLMDGMDSGYESALEILTDENLTTVGEIQESAVRTEPVSDDDEIQEEHVRIGAVPEDHLITQQAEVGLRRRRSSEGGRRSSHGSNRLSSESQYGQTRSTELSNRRSSGSVSGNRRSSGSSSSNWRSSEVRERHKKFTRLERIKNWLAHSCCEVEISDSFPQVHIQIP